VANYGVESLAVGPFIRRPEEASAANQLCDFLAYENRSYYPPGEEFVAALSRLTRERAFPSGSSIVISPRWGKVTSNYVTAEAEGMPLFSPLFFFFVFLLSRPLGNLA